MPQATQFFNYIPRGEGRVALLLYGEVGGWGDIQAKDVVTELMTLEAQYQHIDVHINSPGGDVFTGIAIFNALQSSKADISIYVDGLAASIAGVIALCGKPLFMSQYARLMLHNVSGGAYGSAKSLRETADLIENLEGTLAEMIAERCGMEASEVKKQFLGDDRWFTAEEALALKLIDGITELPQEETPEGLTSDSSTQDIYQAFTNRLQMQASSTNTPMNLYEQIKQLPTFKNVSEGAVVEHIRALENKVVKLESTEQALAQAQAELQTLKDRELEGIVNSAVADGRITEVQKPIYLNLLKTNREEAEKLLNSLTKPQAPQRMARDFTQPQASGGASTKFAGKTWDELNKANLLVEFKAEDPEAFANLYEQHYGVPYQG